MRTVLEAAYHRNGVGGEGFYVALIDDPDIEGRVLLTWFPQYSDPMTETLARYQSRVAVVEIERARQGNIYMHPTGEHPGNNAWRGADSFQDMLPLIMADVETQHDLRRLH